MYTDSTLLVRIKLSYLSVNKGEIKQKMNQINYFR